MEVKFIDFQSSRVSSLVTDLLAFTFTSLPSFIRRQHIDSLLKVEGGQVVEGGRGRRYCTRRGGEGYIVRKWEG